MSSLIDDADMEPTRQGHDTRPLATYPADVLELLASLSLSKMSGMSVLGSQSLRALSATAVSDVDALEVAKGGAGSKQQQRRRWVAGMQRAVRNVAERGLCYQADFKAGRLDQCLVFRPNLRVTGKRVVGWDQAYSIARVAAMREAGYCSVQEAEEWTKLLQEAGQTCSIDAYLQVTASIRPEVVRWSAEEVVAGRKETRCGTLLLEDALQSPVVCKTDVVCWLESGQKWSDVSLIWSLVYSDGSPCNDLRADVRASIGKDCLAYALKGGKGFVKSAKRILSIARLLGRKKDEAVLISWLSGPVGALYGLEADVGTIEWLCENEGRLPIARVKAEMDGFKARLARVYPIALRVEGKALALVTAASKLPSTSAGARKMLRICHELSALFDPILAAEGRRFLVAHKYLPLPKWASP